MSSRHTSNLLLLRRSYGGGFGAEYEAVTLANETPAQVEGGIPGGIGDAGPGEPATGIVDPGPRVAVAQTIWIEDDSGGRYPCWLSSPQLFEALASYGVPTTHLNRLSWPLGASDCARIDVVATLPRVAYPPFGGDLTLRMGSVSEPVTWEKMVLANARPVFPIAQERFGGEPDVAWLLTLKDRRVNWQDAASDRYNADGNPPPFRGVPYGLRQNADADTEIEVDANLDHYYQGTWEEARPATPNTYGALGTLIESLWYESQRCFNWIPCDPLGGAVDRWCMNTGMVYGVRKSGRDFFDRIGGGVSTWNYTWDDLIGNENLPRPIALQEVDNRGKCYPLNVDVVFSRGYSNRFVADINTGDYEADTYYASSELHTLATHLSTPGELDPPTIWDRQFEIKNENNSTANAADLQTRTNQLATLFAKRYRVGNACALWTGIVDIEPCGCTQRIVWGFSREGVPFTRIENTVRWWGYGMAMTDPPPWDKPIHSHGRIRAAEGLDSSVLLTTAPPSVQLGKITNVYDSDATNITYNAVSREDSTLEVQQVASEISVGDGNFNLRATGGNGNPCLMLLPAEDGDTNLTLWVGEEIDARGCP